jgi:uncharacterized phiE125 gp8 family phage protein
MPIVTLAEAKARVRKTGSDKDAEITALVEAAQVVVEHYVGPVVSRQVTEVVDGGRGTIILAERPVLSVTRVREYASATSYTDLTLHVPGGVVAAGYRLDATAGLLYRLAGGASGLFPSGLGNVEVVYTVGRSPVPENVRQAALELVAHWWNWSQIQQGSGGAIGAIVGEEEIVTVGGLGYAVPNRVLGLLTPHLQPKIAIA